MRHIIFIPLLLILYPIMNLLIGVTEGYMEEDYMKFKEASLIAATSFNTNAKIGCERICIVY